MKMMEVGLKKSYIGTSMRTFLDLLTSDVLWYSVQRVKILSIHILCFTTLGSKAQGSPKVVGCVICLGDSFPALSHSGSF